MYEDGDAQLSTQLEGSQWGSHAARGQGEMGHAGTGGALAPCAPAASRTCRLVRATSVSITGPRSSFRRWTSSMMSRRTVAATDTCSRGASATLASNET